jgi:hypothetical protein
MAVRDRPILTDIYPEVNEFLPEKGSVYVLGTSVEQRSTYSSGWEAKAVAKGVEFVRVVKQEATNIEVVINGTSKLIALRSSEQLKSIWTNVGAGTVYLDITGLGHHVWAPLLKSALDHAPQLKAVYIEPLDYRIRANPIEGEIFDLSEKISGIAPIPGFASLTNANDNDVCFVPLVGFEGTRLAYIVEQVQPPGGKIMPVVGVPGFLPHYPFQTYHGNQLPFLQTQAWKNVHFATANCPFSLFYVLDDIAAKHPRDLLKIAPIGTKPHALGAVLYNIARPRQVELVYDHPIRKASRTTGTARLLVYNISAFV